MLRLEVCKKDHDIIVGMFRNETNMVKCFDFNVFPCDHNEINKLVSKEFNEDIDYLEKMFEWKYGHHVAMSMDVLYNDGYDDPSYYNGNLIYIKLDDDNDKEEYEENFLLEKIKLSNIKLCTQSLSVPEIQYGIVMVSLNYICMLIKINDVWGWVDDLFFKVLDNDNEEMEQMCTQFVQMYAGR